MAEPLRHRQTKGAANRHAQPKATAPHFYSTQSGHSGSQPWTSQLVKGFGRRPFATVGLRPGPALEASQGGNRGEVRGPFGERAYGDLRIADGWRARRRGPAAVGVFIGSGGAGRFRCDDTRSREADSRAEDVSPARRCPCCGGRMIIVETFEGPRPWRSPSPSRIRIDSS